MVSINYFPSSFSQTGKMSWIHAVTTMEVSFLICYGFIANFTLQLIFLKYTFVWHFNFFGLCDDFVERFFAVGTSIFSLEGPFFDAIFTENVSTTLNRRHLILFHFFNTYRAYFFIYLRNLLSDWTQLLWGRLLRSFWGVFCRFTYKIAQQIQTLLNLKIILWAFRVAVIHFDLCLDSISLSCIYGLHRLWVWILVKLIFLRLLFLTLPHLINYLNIFEIWCFS